MKCPICNCETGVKIQNVRSYYSENNFQISKFIKGDRVFHVKFGMGNVININDDKLDIKFDNAGYKKIQSNFVKKQ